MTNYFIPISGNWQFNDSVIFFGLKIENNSCYRLESGGSGNVFFVGPLKYQPNLTLICWWCFPSKFLNEWAVQSGTAFSKENTFCLGNVQWYDVFCLLLLLLFIRNSPRPTEATKKAIKAHELVNLNIKGFFLLSFLFKGTIESYCSLTD